MKTCAAVARYLTLGTGSLSDAELLALLIRPERALTVAPSRIAAILAEPGTIPGLTDFERARLSAVSELSRRALACEMKARDSLTAPAAVRGYLRLSMQHLEHECFWVIALDAQNRVIDARELFRGTLTQTSVYPREVVKHALAVNAASLILAHNHPSGVAEPSIQDQALTRTLTEALALVDVKVLDHFIVAPGSCLSFAERGLI